MYSLFHVIADQHGGDIAPVRCNQQAVWRLVRYFEDVVLDNKLSSLVIEGRCLFGDPRQEGERLGKIAAAARQIYLFSCGGDCPNRHWEPPASSNLIWLQEESFHTIDTGPFVVILDNRFCGLIASCHIEDRGYKSSYEVIWSFDPNVVFTGVEYLLARLSTNKLAERGRFEELIKECTPHSPSLRLALTLTTKLAMLMQRQSELEMAINTISSAISSTLDLDQILQSAVEEVGRALAARQTALVLWREGTNQIESINVYERDENEARGALVRETAEESMPRTLEIPLTYRGSQIGLLAVEDDTPGRNWEDEEILMVKTVSDQLAVAISHARLFRRVQMQAMTDPLTGLYNHRYFRDRLKREIELAVRDEEKVSLILLDLDHLKQINDTKGHLAGDECLRHVANVLKAAVRSTDICARYGGEEFVVILPQCDREEALGVAERIRSMIASSPVEGVGWVTASIGVATYPLGASSSEELIEMADRAMYMAKAAGRNRVRSLIHPVTNAPSPNCC
jgi:diguanylate cyclase (GGDEF)-like protein